MKKYTQQSHTSGFTLIELTMALAVFAFMLLILSVGVLQIMKLYQSDLASKRTQEAARTVMDEISRGIRDASNITAHASWLCLNSDKLAIWQGNDSLTVTSNPKNCEGGDFSGGVDTLLIDGSANSGSNVQARQFTPTAIFDSQGRVSSVKIDLTVTTGGGDLIGNGSICNAGAGSQYCSSTTFTNIVTPRGQL